MIMIAKKGRLTMDLGRRSQAVGQNVCQTCGGISISDTILKTI